MVISYKPKNDLVVTMDTDEDEDTMNSDDATAKKNVELEFSDLMDQFFHLDRYWARLTRSQREETTFSN